MMCEFALMDYESGWVQQLHLGALRNNSTRMFRSLGADVGCDSIGDFVDRQATFEVPGPA